jgi:HK97 family phage major capsid protein
MDRTTLVKEKDTQIAKAREISAKAETEGREFTDEERGQVKAAFDAAKKAHDSLAELDGDVQLLAGLNALGMPVGDLAKGGGDAPGQGKSLGERFTDAAQFKEWLAHTAPGGQISEKSRVGNSPPVSFAGIDDMLGRKNILTGTSQTSGGALVFPQWLGLQDIGPFQRPLIIRDLVTTGTTGSDTVEYARVTGFTNNAATVPEAHGTAGGITGGDVPGTKPETNLTLEKVVATVKTIAHWLPATKRALSDAAQVRTLIDNFLMYGLEEELEDEMISGDGTGENFEGVLHVSGTLHQPMVQNILVTARKARTILKTQGRVRPTAYVFNPIDNEKIDLERDTLHRFFGNGPFGMGPDVLWGLPRIESEAVPEGTGICADWRMAVLWDREQAGIQVSDSHADFFVRNLVAILAEVRAAFGIIRPKGFCTIDTAGGS